MPIQWLEQFATGEAVIDDQHKRILMLANNTSEASSKAEMINIAKQLIRCTESHFKYEEDLMREIGFPGLTQHRDEHERLFTRLNMIIKSIEANVLNKVSLDALISDWAVNHIPKSDMEISAFLANQH